MQLLNKRASTFPLAVTGSDPNPHHFQHQPDQQQHQLHQINTTNSAHISARASSEQGFYSAASTTTCTPRTSSSDEAQACFNLLLILRADTQHLISLRNDNIETLERTIQAKPLLQSINDALAAAARSIAELGPFLERHRWPIYIPTTPTKTGSAGCDIAAQNQKRPFVSYSLKPIFLRRSKDLKGTTATATTPKKRRRCKSLTNSPNTTTGAGTTANSPKWEEEAGWLSPEVLFAWTLELTAQHTAALVALERLEQFLVYGDEALRDSAGEDEVKAAKARQEDAARKRISWWEQQRGEFENVDLIQSLLTGPRRKRWGETEDAVPSTAPTDEMTAAVRATSDGSHHHDEHDGAVSNLPSISEQQDDGRSMTITSEPPSELSMPSTPHWGLTARPRVPRKPIPESTEHEPLRTRRVMTEPLSLSSSQIPQQATNSQPLYEPAQLSSRSETFGQNTEDSPGTSTTTTILPLSRFNSLRQRPRIATQPLPPLVGMSLLPQLQVIATITTVEGGTTHNMAITNENNDNNNYLSLPLVGASSSSALSASVTTPLLSPLYTPGGQQAPSPSSPSPSPGVETPYTPYTPLDQQLATLFAQKALPSKTIQPVIRELEDMIVSPVESQEIAMMVASSSPFEHGVSPITISGGASSANLPSPRKGSLVSLSSSMLQRQREAAQGPNSSSGSKRGKGGGGGVVREQEEGEDNDGDGDGDGDKHWPYLAYMARKQAVATSRWSLRRSRTTASDSG